MKQHKKACAQCPWRKDSAAGYLGNSTPEQFIAQSESELRMPCHIHVDYERKDWKAQADAAPQCAGRAAHFANRYKHPRNQELMQGNQDPNVFQFTLQFLDHHKRTRVT